MAYDNTRPDRANEILLDVDATLDNLNELRKFEASLTAPTSPVAGQFFLYTPGSGNYTLRERNKDNDAWINVWDIDANDDILFRGVRLGADEKFEVELHTAATTPILESRVSGDSNPRFKIEAGGHMEWGDGSSYLVTLDFDGTDTLELKDGILHFERNSLTDGALSCAKQGDSFDAFSIRCDGYLSWGPGTGAQDTILYRASAKNLRTDSMLTMAAALATNGAFGSYVSGDSNYRWYTLADGDFWWGSGSGPPDTILYRNSANHLKTDDQFTASGALVTKTKAGIPSDGDLQTVEDGALLVDTNNNRLYVRTNGLWMYATLNSPS
jgi:hypothetical protein